MQSDNKKFLPYALSAAVFLWTFIAFIPSLFDGFVVWDDPAFIMTNEIIRGFGPSHLKQMFFGFIEGNYAPLSLLSWAVDYKVWGSNPLGYHLHNLILHESLHLSGARHKQLIVFTQFVYAQNGDDVLQFLITLKNLLHVAGNRVVFLAHNLRVQNAGGRFQRVHGRINTQFRYRARQHGCGV